MTTRREFIGTGLASATGLAMGSAALGGVANAATVHEPMLEQSIKGPGGKWQPKFRLGQGGAPLGGSSGLSMSDGEALATLGNAWNAGIRFYDTSPWYGLGLSERRFGLALHRKPRDSYVLSTKVGRILTGDSDAPQAGWANPDPFAYRYDYSASATRRSIEDSLQRLGLPYIDLVFIHDLSPDNGDMKTSYNQYLQEAIKGAMPELSKMRDEGLIKGWGMGVNTLPPILAANEASDPDVHLAACQYTLMDHQESIEKLFPDCEKHGTTVVVGSPLNNGFLAGRDRYNYGPSIPNGFKQKRDRMIAIAQTHGVDLRTAALQFCAAPKYVSSVIPGARAAHQPAENVNSMSVKIPSGFWSQLRSESLIAENAPIPA